MVRGQSMEILARIGMDKAVRAHETPIEHRRIVWMDKLGGTVLADIEGHKKPEGEEEDSVVAQIWVEQALLAGVRENAESSILWNHELRSYEQTESGVELVTRERAGDAVGTEHRFSCRQVFFFFFFFFFFSFFFVL